LRIKRIRTESGVQQLQISQEFKCAPSKISSIEKGTRDPGTDFYYWFAERTGCSLDYIICGKESLRSAPGDDTPQNPEINNAVKALIDSFFNSSEFAKYMAERNLVPAKYDPGTGLVTSSEAEVINTLREMSADDAVAAMNHVLDFKK